MNLHTSQELPLLAAPPVAETRSAPATDGWRFGAILTSAALLLAAALVAAFVATGPLAWAVGLIYIGYDTWLLGHMVLASRRAVLRPPAPTMAAREKPTLAVLISARNERAALPLALESLRAQTDPADEIIVIDDGSTDNTQDMLAERYAVSSGDGPLGIGADLPGLRVLKKANSGKARSLNAALAHVASDLVVTLDADTVLEPGALAAVRRAFVENADLTAACGVLRPTCAPGGAGRIFELYQTFEYLRSFLWRVAWSRSHTLILVSGAFAIFRRPALAAVGGFDPTSHVEDYELLFRLHRKSLEERGRPLDVRVIADARATTDVPSKPSVFLRQRTRWFSGFIETMVRNRDMVGNPRHGRLGTFHLVVKTIDTLLPIYALAATAALIAFFVRGQSLPTAVLIPVVAKLAYDLTCHVYCLSLHERWQGRRLSLGLFARAALATLSEPFFFQLFRQLGAFLGWVAFLRGGTEWTPQRPVVQPERS